MARNAADGFLVNGSVNNAASSPFTAPGLRQQSRARTWRYNGNFGLIMDNSKLDARPFSLTGQNTPRRMRITSSPDSPPRRSLAYSRLFHNGPMFT